ncbi:hypothetical protein QE152_g1362 [Popillia japonica]|uniref:Uncharacterized protein n=1 Tax=Popillia japonica TaxID=7064 RepID=A0AAW1N809_POPJA
MKRRGIGSVEEMKTLIEGAELITTKLYDNKPVHLLSSFVGVYPTVQVKRWDAKIKSKIDVDCPNAVAIYNQQSVYKGSRFGRLPNCVISDKNLQ